MKTKEEWRALLEWVGGFEGLTEEQLVELDSFVKASILKAIDELKEIYTLTEGRWLGRELKRFIEFAEEDTKESEQEPEGSLKLN